MKIIIRMILTFILIASSGVYSYSEGVYDSHEEGLSAFKAGDYESAKKHFTESEKSYPENPVVAYNLGVTYYSLGDMYRTLEYMNIAISLNKEFGLAYYVKGIVNINMNQLTTGKENFQKGCKLGYEQACTILSNL